MGNFSGTKEDIVLLGCLEGEQCIYDCNELLWFWRDHVDDCDPGSSKESSHTKWGYWVNEVHIHKSQCSRVKLNTWFGLRNQSKDLSRLVPPHTALLLLVKTIKMIHQTSNLQNWYVYEYYESK